LEGMMTDTSKTPRATLGIKVGMYLLSLWLLFVLIIVSKTDFEFCLGCPLLPANELWVVIQKNHLPVIAATFLLISVFIYLHFVKKINGVKDGPYQILELEDKNSEHLVFLATYVIPLVGFKLDSMRDSINLGITLLLLGVIYVRTNLFYANPTLSLLGFRIFNVKLQLGSAILISRQDLSVGDSINVMLLDRRIYFVRKAIEVQQ
jgi:hypothetical protein